MLFRSKYLFLVAFFVGGMIQAHPLGIFSINRYARIELAGDKVRIVYVLDIAEIPSTQEWLKIDLNRDGVADDHERRQYADQIIAKLVNGFQLSIDEWQLSPRATDYSLSFPEGQGGLKTIRLTPIFEAAIPRHDGTLHLSFVDHNYDDRMGWKEVTDRKSTRLNSSHIQKSRMPSSA